MAKKIESITGMAVTADAICLARYLTEERQIANISIQPVDERLGNIWESAETRLKHLITDVKLKGEKVICSLPGEFAVIRKISIDADEPDIDETLKWEFNRHILGQEDEFVVDYEQQPAVPESNVKNFLGVGYRVEAVDSIRKLAASGKLNPIVIDLDIFALINSYEANYRDGTLVPAMCVLSDYAVSKCVLTTEGRFIDMEIINHTKEAHSPEMYSAMIEKTSERLLTFNKGVTSRESMAVMLSGSLFSQPEFAEQVKKTVRNAEMLYPFRTIKCGTGIPEEQLRKYSPHLAVAVGLALRGEV